MYNYFAYASPFSRGLIAKSALLFLLAISVKEAASQVLTLKEAVETGTRNYGTIKAKANYVRASAASVKEANLDHFPNFNLAAQQAYGTVNGQFGPLFAFGGLNTASSGPTFPGQNWHAAFGSLYLANVNWEFFTFGRLNQRVKLAETQVERETNDLEQEKFQHQVRVAGAYLNLLAAQRLKLSQQRNLERVDALRKVVLARTKSGLNPGVDSSLANAEISNARIALTITINYENEQSAQLATLTGLPYHEFQIDTVFVHTIPASLEIIEKQEEAAHPVLKFYRSRIDFSHEQEKYFSRFRYPVFSFVGVVQGRGSGFQTNYNELYPDAYSHNYWNGIKPVRSNYLLGIGVSWNFTNTQRVQQQVAAQAWTSRGLEDEYQVISEQIKTQLALADQRMKNAIANYREAPVQMKAASDAYLQKTVLYRNGLATIVDVTQALFALNRAETDRDIASNNLWQALLLQAAAGGDFNYFMKALP